MRPPYSTLDSVMLSHHNLSMSTQPKISNVPAYPKNINPSAIAKEHAQVANIEQRDETVMTGKRAILFGGMYAEIVWVKSGRRDPESHAYMNYTEPRKVAAENGETMVLASGKLIAHIERSGSRLPGHRLDTTDIQHSALHLEQDDVVSFSGPEEGLSWYLLLPGQ